MGMRNSKLEQWRRQHFFGEGRPGHYHATATGDPGAASPWIVTKYRILKLIKVLENKSIFKNFNFFWPENPLL